jgi:transposase
MHYIIGIDVSKTTSQVTVTVDGKVTQQFKITHAVLGFNQLHTIIMQFNEFPDIVFEATGIYSRRLKSFLDWHNYPYNYFSEVNKLDYFYSDNEATLGMRLVY